MKLLKPHWVSHDGRPIFSIDIHPDGSRFATGGQGQDCGLVNIWNMGPIRSEQDENNPSVPRSLCEMSNHLGCVNSVRWSHDGKWLASGGDDALVMIWQIKYQGITKSSFGGSNPEQWGCVNMLRGHNGDVLGVAWSHDRKYLASCSVDNTIIIWNAKDLPQKVTIITGHEGLVKGLTWDPVGKYIASQSDDRTVRIWRTNDWREIKAIKEPFVNCGGTTHVLRLSWSPDGKFIVTAHALNNDGPTAQIIERGDWKAGIDFVGHRKAVEVVSFNPHLFMKKESADNHGCVAIGSRDRSLSIWLTHLKRPLVVLHDLFTDSILDLSWSCDGYELMVCSTDGSIAYLRFSAKELGVTVSDQALDDIFMATYGSRRAANKRDTNTSAILIEDPTMLKLVSQQELTIKGSVTSTTTTSLLKEPMISLDKKVEMVSTSAAVPSVMKQVETKTTDGRRRITPITLTSQPSSLAGAPLPFTSFSPKQNKGVTVDSNTSEKVTKITSSTSPKKDGLSSIKSPPPRPIHFEPLSPRNESPEKPTIKPNQKDGDKVSTLKRKLELGTTTLIPKSKKLKRTKYGSASTADAPKPGTPQKISITSTLTKQSQVLLTVPEVESSVTVVISKGFEDKQSIIVELENNILTSKYQIKCLKDECVLWSNSLMSPVLLASGNSLVTCAVCSDKSVLLYSTKSGRLLLPKFHLMYLPHVLKVHSSFVLVVNSNATVNVWDVNSFKAIVKEASISHLVQDGKKLLELENVELTSNGLPAITLKGNTYVYHTEMCVWLEASTSLEQTEMHVPDSLSTDDSMPLQALQQAAGNTRTDSVGQMLSSLRNPLSQATTLGYLESQLARSYCLQSPLEYTHWCTVYVRYLVKEEQETRLREFCEQFTGPAGSEGARIVGVVKHAMLRDFLPIIAGNPRLQRLYCELRDSLDVQIHV